MSLLRASGLELELGGSPVLAGVDFALAPGELVGLIGANGAGKSSLLRCLAGLRSPDAGRVELAGRPIAAHAPTGRARLLGYLPQDGGAHWPLAVRDLVTLGRLPYRPRWSPPRAADRDAVESAMARCDVQALAERSVATLSGGERARVLLARALAGEPRALLADEPVAGIDPAHQIAVMELLAARAREGSAALVVLHDLHLAARYCTRLVLLDHGRVAADGAWREVLEAERLAATLGVRLFVGESDGGPVVAPVARAGDAPPG